MDRPATPGTPAEESPSIDVTELPAAGAAAPPSPRARALRAANPDTRVPLAGASRVGAARTGETGAAETAPKDSAAEPAKDPAAEHAKEPATEPGKAAAPTDDLHEELSALDTVRRKTASGDPRTALRLLSAYEKRFPAGKLREEALVLRIEALAANGERESAERLAKLLFGASPYTPYAARVRAALGRRSEEQ